MLYIFLKLLAFKVLLRFEDKGILSKNITASRLDLSEILQSSE